MAQNIIELGFDINKFSAEKQAIYDDLVAMYEMAKKINETKIAPATGGWTELKAQVEALKKQVSDLQEANLRYAESQQKVTTTTTAATAAIQKETVETNKATAAEEAYAQNAALLQKVLAGNEIALKRLAVTKKQLYEADRDGKISTEEYQDALALVNGEILKYKTSSQQLTLALKNIEKAEQEQEGSLNQLRAQLNLMLFTQDKMGESTEEEIQLKKELGERIKELTAEISQQEQAQGKFSRNVGNYANSMAAGFEKVRAEIARLKKEQEDLQAQKEADPSGFDARGGEAQIQRTTAALTELEQVQKVALNTGGNFTRQVSSLNKEFITMSANGNVSQQFLEEFQKELITAQREAKDLKEQMRAMASETRGFDLMSQSIDTVASGFQLAAGTVALFGVNEETSAKITAQMVAIQNVANGARELATQLTTKASAAGMFYTWVQRQIAIATDSTAAASKRLNAALGLLGLAVTVIGALVAVFGGFSKRLSEAEKAQERLNKVNEEAIDVYTAQIFEVDNLVRKIKDENTTNREKAEIIDEVNQKYGDLTGEIKTMNDLETKFVDKSKEIKDALMIRAKAQVAYGMAIDAAKESLKLQMVAESESNNRFERLIKKAAAKGKEEADKQSNYFLVLFQQLQGQADLLAKTLNPMGGTLTKEFSSLGESIGGGVKTEKKSGGGSKQRDFAAEVVRNEDELRRALNEIELKKLRDKMEATKLIMDDEKLSFAQRAELEREFYNNSLDLVRTKSAQEKVELELAYNEEISKASGHKGLIASINKEYDAKRKLLAIQTNSEIEQLNRESEQRITADTKKEMEFREQERLRIAQEAQDHYVAMYELDQSRMKNAYEKKQNDLDNLFNTGQIKEKEYNKRKLELQSEFQIEALRKEIEFTKEVLKMAYIRAQATGNQEDLDKVAKGFEQLKGLENQLQDAMQRIARAKKEGIKADFQEIFEFVAGIAQNLMGVVGGFIDAHVTKQKNAIQELINKNNEYGNAELQRITESTLSEQDKAAKVIQLKAEVDARNQQYAKRQRDLDIEKAKFDKVNAVASIILNTALAVTKALPNVPLAILAGIMGAAQLAVAVATPIPTYAEGTDFHPGGLARYGEAGKEKVILPDGSSFIADKDTTGYLPRGAKVIPLTADTINDAMYGSMIQSTAERIALVEAAEKIASIKDDAWKIAKWQADETRKALEANNKKQPVNITNRIDMDWITYLNKYIFGK